MQELKVIEAILMISVSAKFPEGTVAGLYKRAVADNQYHDAVRFGAQRINWTLKEFDVRSPSSFCIEILLCIRFRPPREWLRQGGQACALGRPD